MAKENQEAERKTPDIPLRLNCIRKDIDGIFSVRVDIDHSHRISNGSVGIVKGVRIDLIGDKEGSTLNQALYNVCVELSNIIQEVHYNK